MKKDRENPDKPKKSAHNRIVARIKCIDDDLSGRRKDKPGGYPVNKKSPVIKCVPKGKVGIFIIEILNFD